MNKIKESLNNGGVKFIYVYVSFLALGWVLREIWLPGPSSWVTLLWWLVIQINGFFAGNVLIKAFVGAEAFDEIKKMIKEREEALKKTAEKALNSL